MKVTIIPVGMLGTNCYILSSGAHGCAVIDPGAQPEKIITRINDDKLTVKYVLLTHGHHDHIGEVKRMLEEYPEAKLYIGKNDLEMLTDGQKSLASIRHPESDKFFIEKAETLTEGQVLELDELKIRVIETPGHSKGCICLICGDTIFSGDTLFCGDVGRCDLYGGDYGVMKASLRKLAALDGDFRVYPGHGESTSLNFERTNNPYIAEALGE